MEKQSVSRVTNGNITMTTTMFKWRIENFSKLNNVHKHYSDVFFVGYHKWRVLIFPTGNTTNHFSIYLKAVNTGNWPNAQFSFSVINQINDRFTVRKDTEQHQFTAAEDDWGFTKFMVLSELYGPHKGYIVNDTCIVELEICVHEVMEKSAYNSGKTLSGILSLEAAPPVEKPVEVVPPTVKVLPPFEVVEPFANMDPVAESVLEPKTQTKLDGQRNELEEVVPPVEVVEPVANMVPVVESVLEPETQTKLDGQKNEPDEVVPPVEVVEPVANMDPVAESVQEPEIQTKLDGQRNEPDEVAETDVEWQLEEHATESWTLVEPVEPITDDHVTVSMPTIQESKTVPLPEYQGAGQLFEEGKHCLDVLGDKLVDIGGFSIFKPQAFLYEQIWLKYGHIASSEVLLDSYPGQVALVTDIMNTILDMHHKHLNVVSSEMIDSWEKKIKMAEKLEFNIWWLRERFEDVKKDFNREQKLKAALLEEDQSLVDAKARLIAAEKGLIEAQDELKKAQENVSALETRINPLLSERQQYLGKGNRSVLDGMFK